MQAPAVQPVPPFTRVPRPAEPDVAVISPADTAVALASTASKLRPCRPNNRNKVGADEPALRPT